MRLLVVAYRSNNFVVGLTNVNPEVSAPVMWSYTLCGQYPGAVPAGATVTVYCTHIFERRLSFQYVVLQFPLINDQMNICEVEVYAVGTLFQFAVHFFQQCTNPQIRVMSYIVTVKKKQYQYTVSSFKYIFIQMSSISIFSRKVCANSVINVQNISLHTC